MKFKYTIGIPAVILVFGLGVLAAAGVDNVRLVNAVKNHDLAAIRTLLKQHADPNTPDVDGTTPLIWAAHNGDSEIGRLLISAGASVKVTNRYGVTALVEAATIGDVAMMEVLLKAGADPNATYGAGETPLMLAARTGNVNAVKLLIDWMPSFVISKFLSRTLTSPLYAASRIFRSERRKYFPRTL